MLDKLPSTNQETEQTKKKPLPMWMAYVSGAIIFIIVVVAIYFLFLREVPEPPEKQRIVVAYSETFTVNGLQIKVTDHSTSPSGVANFVEVDVTIEYYNPTTENIRLGDISDSLYFINNGTAARYGSLWYSNPDNVTFKPYEKGNLTYRFNVPDTIIENLGKGKADPSATSYFEIRFQINKSAATEYYVVKI